MERCIPRLLRRSSTNHSKEMIITRRVDVVSSFDTEPNGIQYSQMIGILFLGVLCIGTGIWSHSNFNDSIMNPLLHDAMHFDRLKHDRIRDLWTNETFKCIGWRATNNCDPNGPRIPSLDVSCDTMIIYPMSGYCEIENRTNGERFRVMKTSCRGLDPTKSKFTCNMAREFTDFSVSAAKTNSIQSFQSTSPRGIGISIYPSVLESVYAIIRLLRQHGCTLPIELWYRSDELDNPLHHPILRSLQFDRITFREINAPWAISFLTKPYAIIHSSFESVLFLDSDNLPVRDPTYLFDTVEFRETGALFWPDFWHPTNSLFNMHGQSLLWQALDMSFEPTFEQESGQLLINRTQSASALAKLLHYSSTPLLDRMGLVWGDKDLYRLAWRNTSTPFHFISYPPALGGLSTSNYFCGVSMLQYDMYGELLFFHRNTVKLTADTTRLLTHIQSYDDSHDYTVSVQGKRLGQSICFFLTNKNAKIKSIDTTPYHMIEIKAIEYAKEANSIDIGSIQQHQSIIKSTNSIVEWNLFFLFFFILILSFFGILFNTITIREYSINYHQQYYIKRRKPSTPIV